LIRQNNLCTHVLSLLMLPLLSHEHVCGLPIEDKKII